MVIIHWGRVCIGTDAASYFEKRFPDVDPINDEGVNANCAEWLLSITTKVCLQWLNTPVNCHNFAMGLPHAGRIDCNQDGGSSRQQEASSHSVCRSFRALYCGLGFEK